MLFTNIVHRLDVSADARRALEFQWIEARRFGLPTTTLISYPALFDKEALADARRLWGEGDELGLHFHNMQCRRLGEKYGIREPALWLWPREQRMAVIDEMVGAFTGEFGRPPASIGGYIIDAWTLARIRERHPTIRTAITSCFEEGVKMFYGNNRNWMLFSDGGPWNPYFPSRANALVPARDADEAIDVVAVPHLNRDMIEALSSRDDWFASHPGNVIRARINQGPGCPYLFRFFRAWERQGEINGWSYLNIFVSSPWMSGRHWCVEREEDARALYTATLEHLKEREQAGVNRNLTMDAFGAEFRQRSRAGAATVCHWRDELRQSKREVVWVVNSHHRCCFDLGRGGALVDWRVYGGRLDGDLGPETACLWNGNYPFLVSTEHCGGHWNTAQTTSISDGRHSVNLADRRVRATVEGAGSGAWNVVAAPCRFDLGGVPLVIQSSWDIDSTSRVTLRRKVLEYGGDPACLRLTETLSARPGTNEYPPDLRGILLQVEGAGGGVQSMPFGYSGRCLEIAGCRSVSAVVPMCGVEVLLTAADEQANGRVEDGLLFSPPFRLHLEHRVNVGKEILTCLSSRPSP